MRTGKPTTATNRIDHSRQLGKKEGERVRNRVVPYMQSIRWRKLNECWRKRTAETKSTLSSRRAVLATAAAAAKSLLSKNKQNSLASLITSPRKTKNAENRFIFSFYR